MKKLTFTAIRSIPSLIRIPGWWWLPIDLAGWKRKPYRVGRHTLRPGTMDLSVYVEIFVGQCYRGALPYLGQAEQILDIGGNIGAFAHWCLAHNPKVVVHSFEPVRSTSERIPADPRLKVYPYAVGAFEGNVPAIQGGKDECHLSYRLSGQGFIADGGQASVAVVDAAKVFEACGVKGFEVVKLDCEGAEKSVLTRLPMPPATRCVIFETHIPEEHNELLALMEGRGFRLASFDPYHRVMCWTR